MLIPQAVQRHIDEVLSNTGVQIEWDTLKKPSTQGMMTLMTTVESTIGRLVIHYNPEPLDEQRRVEMACKIAATTDYLLHNVPDVPTQKTVAAQTLPGGSYYIIQEFIPGSPLGARTIEGNQIVDSYVVPSESVEALQRQVDEYTALLHNHPMPGFGFLVVQDGVLRGSHESWESFLTEASAGWIRELYDTASDSSERTQVEKVERGITSLFDACPEPLSLPQGYFVHGDIVNLSNILVEDNTVTGIIDFELTVSGDPAWEFTHTKTPPSEHYFAMRGIQDSTEKEAFLRRIGFCSIFWSTWGAFLHCRINRYGLKEMLLERAVSELEAFS